MRLTSRRDVPPKVVSEYSMVPPMPTWGLRHDDLIAQNLEGLISGVTCVDLSLHVEQEVREVLVHGSISRRVVTRPSIEALRLSMRPAKETWME